MQLIGLLNTSLEKKTLIFIYLCENQRDWENDWHLDYQPIFIIILKRLSEL